MCLIEHSLITVMDFEEFESQTRNTLEQTLNQLHAANLMVAQLEMQLSEAGRTIQALSLQVEAFIVQHRQQSQRNED